MIKVKLIAAQGAAAIVEYQKSGKIERAIVPNAEVRNGYISKRNLERGIPYGGVELADYLPKELTIKTDDLQALLRQRGLWTYEDYYSNPQVILGALQKLYGVDVTRILNEINKAGNNDDNL